MPIFAPENLKAAVTQALAAADVGEDTNALVAVVTYDRSGAVVVRGVIAHRFTTDAVDWTVSAIVGIDHQAHVDGGVQVKATWK